MEFTVTFTEGIKDFGNINQYLEFLVRGKQCCVMVDDSKLVVINIVKVTSISGLRPNEKIVFRVPTKAFLHFVDPGEEIDFIVTEQDVVMTKFPAKASRPSSLRVKKQVISEAKMNESISLVSDASGGKYAEIDFTEYTRFGFLASKLLSSIEYDGESLFCSTPTVQMYSTVKDQSMTKFCASSLEFYKLLGDERKIYNVRNSLVSVGVNSITILRKEVPRVASDFQFIKRKRSAMTFTVSFEEVSREIKRLGKIVENIEINFSTGDVFLTGTNFSMNIPLDIKDTKDRKKVTMTSENFLELMANEKQVKDEVVITMNKWQKEMLGFLKGNLEIDVFPHFIKIVDGDMFIIISRKAGV